jgi:hypothetical protein
MKVLVKQVIEECGIYKKAKMKKVTYLELLQPLSLPEGT